MNGGLAQDAQAELEKVPEHRRRQVLDIETARRRLRVVDAGHGHRTVHRIRADLRLGPLSRHAAVAAQLSGQPDQ